MVTAATDADDEVVEFEYAITTADEVTGSVA